jgi:hypothetical protein
MKRSISLDITPEVELLITTGVRALNPTLGKYHHPTVNSFMWT